MRQLLYLLLLSVSIHPAIGFSQVPRLLDPLTQPRFKNKLPVPAVIDARGGGTFTIPVTQFSQDLGLKSAAGQPLLTTVWGYGGTYPGPTILAKKNVPISIYWPNNLVNGNKPLNHLLPIDPTLHWALEDYPNWQTYGVPIVTHLHGGQTESESDGLPDAWYTPNFALTGSYFTKGKPGNPYYYSNAQEAATIWYHDHAIGITRLNVYAGMAGYYIVTDPNEEALQAGGQLPSGAYDIGLAIQDRMFTSKGELYYPTGDMTSMPGHLPEFFGDFILVNGMAWPLLNVEPRQYRFRLLNGSDSRFYNLSLSTGTAMVQIGSDVGLLRAPVSFHEVLIAPGERKDIVIDFSALWGQTIILQNDAHTPFPDGAPVDPLTAGQIMAFKVGKKLNPRVPLTTLPAVLRPEIERLSTTLEPRKLILFEGEDEHGRLQALLGTAADGPLHYLDAITENPGHNTTEIWEIYNTTVDAHPVHLHMVKMQLINRQKFEASFGGKNNLAEIELEDEPVEPGPEEQGWKDTYIAYPGEVTRIIAKFEIPGLSAWHCHILSHEDHEMMRPYFIGEMPGGNNMVTKVTAAAPDLEQQLRLRLMPNPFNADLKVQLQLPQAATLSVSVYDATGRRMQQVFSGRRDAGPQQFSVDGSRWSNGSYFCEIIVDGKRMVRKLTLQK